MTTTKPKQVDGAIQDMTPTPDNPTSVLLAGKTIYLPPDKRALFNSQKYKVGEVIRLRYDRDGNYINSERLPREAHQIAIGSGSETHTALEPEHPEMHIQQETAKDRSDRSPTSKAVVHETVKDVYIQHGTEMGPKDHEKQGTSEPERGQKNVDMHIQKDTVQPQPHWMTEREKNDTIVIQSLIARATEILDGIYRDYPEFTHSNGNNFEEILVTRCDNIEVITDRLFEYVKKKISDEQKKGRP